VRVCSSLILATSILAAPAFAQQQPIAYVRTDGVSLSGSLAVENGKASIGNNGTVTAGDSTAHIQLARGGELRLCASTKVHLSKDASANTSSDPATDSALMIALDRGAMEASYTPGKYSDVLLTPDLRILISGPGQADLKIRTNEKGDTCIDNHGANAPYVTVTSQFEDGLYRVQANQRVMIEHGSLQQVVDNEPEPCGCPPEAPPVSVASAAPGITPGNYVAKPAHPGAGPSSTPGDNAFPLAQSEGLKPPPAQPLQPEVPAGTTHAEVQAPITYDAKMTPNPAQPGAAGPPPEPTKAEQSGVAGTAQSPDAAPAQVPAPASANAKKPATQKTGSQGGIFHAIGRFFVHLFGGS
jgi:hypothetical protein